MLGWIDYTAQNDVTYPTNNAVSVANAYEVYTMTYNAYTIFSSNSVETETI